MKFECGDVVLHGDQWHGSQPGREVLFLHGGGQTRHSWGRAAEEFARSGWTSTTVDLRGHGDSDWSRNGEYGLDVYASDLKCVVEQLAAQPVLVGASLGGLTALTAQAHEPNLARALVLVDIVPRASAAGVSRIRDFMTAHLRGFGSLEEVADTVAAYTGRDRRRDPSGLQKNVRLRDDGRWYWHWDPNIIQTRRDVGQGPALDVEKMLNAARSVSSPVLIVRGEHSDVVTDEAAQELQRELVNGSVIEVPGAGHMVAGDDNDIFAKTVLKFIDSLPI